MNFFFIFYKSQLLLPRKNTTQQKRMQLFKTDNSKQTKKKIWHKVWVLFLVGNNQIATNKCKTLKVKPALSRCWRENKLKKYYCKQIDQNMYHICLFRYFLYSYFNQPLVRTFEIMGLLTFLFSQIIHPSFISRTDPYFYAFSSRQFLFCHK